MHAGSPTCRLTGRLTLTLHGAFGGEEASERHVLALDGTDDPALKGIVVAATATARLELHGALFFPTWTRLAAHTPGTTHETTAAPNPGPWWASWLLSTP